MAQVRRKPSQILITESTHIEDAPIIKNENIDYKKEFGEMKTKLQTLSKKFEELENGVTVLNQHLIKLSIKQTVESNVDSDKPIGKPQFHSEMNLGKPQIHSKMNFGKPLGKPQIHSEMNPEMTSSSDDEDLFKEKSKPLKENDIKNMPKSWQNNIKKPNGLLFFKKNK